MPKCLIGLISTLIVFNAFSLKAEQSWQLYKEKQGISAYTKLIPGSKYLAVKGSLVLEVALPVVGNILRDIPSFPLWMKTQKESLLLHKSGNRDFIIYNTIHLVWFLENRDVIFRSRITVDPDSGNVLITSAALKQNLRPVRDDHVRMHQFYQQFKLEFLEKHKTRVSFVLNMDPLVFAPVSLVNSRLKQSVFDILTGLKKMVTNKKYHQESYFSDFYIDLTRAVCRARLKKRITDDAVIERIVMDTKQLRQLIENQTQTGTPGMGRAFLEEL